jgi:hypothetical protein
MKGKKIKSEIERWTTENIELEGKPFKDISFDWTGASAGVLFNRFKKEAEFKLPILYDEQNYSETIYAKYKGYALHELGHLWFTSNKPLDKARKLHGGQIGRFINGLEDVRIEREVIKTGLVKNAQLIFEYLVNEVLEEDGYVEPDDEKNIPFMLAIEGRRRGGYAIESKTILNYSVYGYEILNALTKLDRAKNTLQATQIAIELQKEIEEIEFVD